MNSFKEGVSGGCQYLEQPNVERPIVRNYEISNIKRTKDELLDFLYFLIYSLFLYLFKLFVHSNYMIIYKI